MSVWHRYVNERGQTITLHDDGGITRSLEMRREASQENRPCIADDGTVYQHDTFIDGGGGVVWCIDGEWAREVDYYDEDGIEHTGYVSIRTGEAIP